MDMEFILIQVLPMKDNGKMISNKVKGFNVGEMANITVDNG
jgi:hypothetical protein